ncbi:kelch repeat-containing protein [Cladorrhinum sp. PSN332]|nr:kelch repeat-containing protein [Cladorrhinum sp. PSN332]
MASELTSGSRILHHLVLPGLLGYVSSVNALSDNPTPENFIRRALHQATVLGNYVYIDGGEISQYENNKRGRMSDPVNSTLSIDISKSWSIDKVEIKTIEKPREIPVKSRAYLWTDAPRQEFYIWGGFWAYSYKKADLDYVPMAKFKADGNGGGTWALVEMADQEMLTSLRPTEVGAPVQVNNTAFLMGGQWSDLTDQRVPTGPSRAVPGLVTWDFTTGEIQNSTLPDFSPFGSETRVGASAIYVPAFGPNGLVFLMGGHSPPIDRAYSISDTRALPLSNLGFFDPITRESFTQTATGDAPRFPRRAFCIVGFETQGGYDVFLFGGDNAAGKVRYDDAYVLSLPAFHWIKLPSSNKGLRAYHACVRVGKRQVLSIGGNFEDGNWGEPDPANRGLLLFDMTALEWKNDYDANAAPYERADAIKTLYENGSFSHNIQWSSEKVQQMFAVQNPPAPSASEAPTGNKSSSTPAGTIAGGVVGGIAGLALVAIIAWLLFRRKRKQDSGSKSQLHQHELGAFKELKEGGNMHMMPNNMNPHEMSTERPVGELPAYSTKPPATPKPEESYHQQQQQQQQQNYVAPVELDGGYAGPNSR